MTQMMPNLWMMMIILSMTSLKMSMLQNSMKSNKKMKTSIKFKIIKW